MCFQNFLLTLLIYGAPARRIVVKLNISDERFLRKKRTEPGGALRTAFLNYCIMLYPIKPCVIILYTKMTSLPKICTYCNHNAIRHPRMDPRSVLGQEWFLSQDLFCAMTAFFK